MTKPTAPVNYQSILLSLRQQRKALEQKQERQLAAHQATVESLAQLEQAIAAVEQDLIKKS